MPCECGYADECDGENAIFYPLQDEDMCSVQNCRKAPEEAYCTGYHCTGDCGLKGAGYQHEGN